MEDEQLSTQPESNETDVTAAERSLLDESIENTLTNDSMNLRHSKLDDTDDEGTPLNEKSDDLSGEDLDVPGAEADDDNEMIGEEDEQNNAYSQADTE